jgi:acyl-CoA synthetase (AMP-forming)/AMP-acid ligase II
MFALCNAAAMHLVWTAAVESRRGFANSSAMARVADMGVPLLTSVEMLGDGALVSQTRCYGTWLRGRGVRPGDRIEIIMNNHPVFVDAKT